MDHLAILSKDRKLLKRIISGEKNIESRWYKNKKPPFGTISKGDTIYFKESGEPVTAVAVVDKVLLFDDLNEHKIQHIISKYGSGILLDRSHVKKLIGKHLCVLIFLHNVREVEPFMINKKGYGNMAAWITIDNINKIKAR